MQSKGSGPVNRVELECQVLCAALRQSCVKFDKIGISTSVRELSHLFPDLLPPVEEGCENRADYYEILNIRPQAGLSTIMSSYFRQVRNFLKHTSHREAHPTYSTILNAGLILRKPRLRLSHDLVVARRWLEEQSGLKATDQYVKPVIQPEPDVYRSTGPDTIEETHTQPEPALQHHAEAPDEHKPDTVESPETAAASAPPATSELVTLMEAARLITDLEVQALKAQIQLAPDIAAEQLILNAGYATATELASLNLARELLAKRKISMAQFQVAMYDERMSGLRMAESLQVRGWLETEVKNPLE